MDHPVVRYAILIASAAVLQYAVAPQFRLAGVSVDLLLVLAVAAGMHSGVERGAVVGFASGLALDLLVVTPFGLGAIAYLTAGGVAGLLEAATVLAARWLTMAIAAIASTVGLLTFAIVGAVLGRSDLLGIHLLVVVLVVAPTSALLVLPALRACRWADPEIHRVRTAVHRGR